MKIKISEAYEKFRNQIGIRISEIEQTIRSPDRVTVIDLNKVQETILGYAEGKALVLNINLKHFFGTNGGYYILTVSHDLSDGVRYVGDALKILPQISQNIEEMTPIDVLQEFIDIFGVEQTILGKSSKFFYGELIPTSNIKSTQVTPIMHLKENHSAVQTNFIKIDSITNQIFCGLAYCIDFTEYVKFMTTSQKIDSSI